MDIINEIILEEWKMFQEVNNVGGRASCQDDFKTFKIMRASQLNAWSLEVLDSYQNDLKEANILNRNLISEKYARMMKYTHKAEYDRLKGSLYPLSKGVIDLVEEILTLNAKEENDLNRLYPNVRKRGRQNNGRGASVDIYLKGELLTYSEKTLKLLLEHMVKINNAGESLAKKINENMVKEYGYSSLEEAEEILKLKIKE